MAIKNTNLGGTDWGGEGVASADLNDTFDAALIKVSTKTDATEASDNCAAATNSAPTWVTLKDYTFTPTNSNNMLLGIKISADVKVDTDSAYYRIKITNDTTSEVCYVGNEVYSYEDNVPDISHILTLFGTSSTSYETKTAEAFIPSGVEFGLDLDREDETIPSLGPAMINGSTYSIEIQAAKGSYAGGDTITAYIDEIDLKLFLIDGMNAVTTGWS